MSSEIKVAEPVACVNSPAPCDEEPVYTREKLTQPPDWRYQAALQFLFDERDGIPPEIPSDPIVQYTIRALRAKRSARANFWGRLTARMWPIMSEVIYLGTVAKGLAITTQMEACMIKGWDWDEARISGCPVCRETYDLYSKIFFDLEGVRAIHAWINDYLFEPAKYSSTRYNNSVLRSRMLAYFGSGADGVTSMISGMLSPTEEKLATKIIKTEHQKKVLDYVTGVTGLSEESYSEIMEAAVKMMTEHDFQEHMKDREDAGSSSLEELATNMEEGIRAYSQRELGEFNAAGIDFINQYTELLSGKQKDGETNNTN